MSNVERFGTFYAPWPVIDGKPLSSQWGEIRRDTAELKVIARNSFQELQDGQEELNAIRALLGLAFGDLVFSKRYRFYYNKSTFEFCLQKNDGTVESPTWTDVWCVRLSDGQFQVVSNGGILSEAGFYGPDLERLEQIGETGSDGDESFRHRSKLFFNVDDGFELNEIPSGGNQGGVEVRFTAPFGRAQEFPKVGKEWVVQHDYGISPVLVQVMDGDKRVIIPDLADVSDPNIAYFYFNEVTTGSVYIASGGVGATSLIPRDPFYLVARTDMQAAASRTMKSNAELVFDSHFFYVNVDLDAMGGGSRKSAFISFIPGTDVNVSGSPNIAVDPGPIIRLQEKLTGMEAFYFQNGSQIFETGIPRLVNIISTGDIEINASGTAGGGNGDIEILAAQDVLIEAAAGNMNIRAVSAGNQLLASSPGNIEIESTAGSIDIIANTQAQISAGANFPVILSTGPNRLTLGRDGVLIGDKCKAEAFYISNGGNIFTTGTTMKIQNPGGDLEVSSPMVDITAGSNEFRIDGESTRTLKPVIATGFYFQSVDQSAGWDLSKASLEIHIPSPSADTPYFLVNFVDQAFIVDDVKLASTAGYASFGFYIQNSLEFQAHRGVGIVGTGKDGNTLAEFYVVPSIRKVTALSENVVQPGGSLLMTCLTVSSAVNVRGRVAIRLVG